MTYPSRRDTTWFGFDAVHLDGLPQDGLLVPLAGHTPGHCAVAVRGDDRWLLHAGDAFYYDGQIAPERWEINTASPHLKSVGPDPASLTTASG